MFCMNGEASPDFTCLVVKTRPFFFIQIQLGANPDSRIRILVLVNPDCCFFDGYGDRSSLIRSGRYRQIPLRKSRTDQCDSGCIVNATADVLV